MAIAGSMTVAYRYRLVAGVIVCDGVTTRPRRDCTDPAEAAQAVMAGGVVVVAGGDAGRFRELVTGRTVRGEAVQS